MGSNQIRYVIANFQTKWNIISNLKTVCINCCNSHSLSELEIVERITTSICRFFRKKVTKSHSIKQKALIYARWIYDSGLNSLIDLNHTCEKKVKIERIYRNHSTICACKGFVFFRHLQVSLLWLVDEQQHPAANQIEK